MTEHGFGKAAGRARANPGRSLRVWVLCCALLLAPGVVVHADDATIIGLIAERLSLMKDVAAYKYLAGMPVEDPDREAVLIAHAAVEAGAAGLDRETTVPFFAAQIEAAKAIQHCWIDRWANDAATAPAEAPDLTSDIRPRLIEIGDALIAALADGSRGDLEPAPLPGIDCLPPAAADEMMMRLVDVLAGSP